jgi:hypothetical protein
MIRQNRQPEFRQMALVILETAVNPEHPRVIGVV